LNLGDVNYIDSSGIGELVSAFTTAKNQGGDSNCSTSQEGPRPASDHQTLHVFDVKEDEAAAVKSFTK